MAFASIHNARGFLSDYWLGSVLGSRRGGGAALPRLSSAQAARALRRLERLLEHVDRPVALAPGDFRERFARPLLGDILGYVIIEDAESPDLRRLAAVATPEQALLPVLLLAEDAKLDARETRRRLDAAMLAAGCGYGLCLSPTALRLYRRPGDGPAGAYLELALPLVVETQDTDSLAAVWSLLGAHAFHLGADGSTPIARVEAESRRHAARVSEDLKGAVFESAEILVRGFIADLQDRPEVAASAAVSELGALRDAALLCLYRLLFILYAESRDDRLQTHRLYLESYSLERLADRLLRTPPDALAGNRFGVWAQVQVLFRIYDEGLNVGNLPGLQNIPPRGGTLFSPATPQGTTLGALRLPDREAAHLLLTLATTKPRRGVGRERVSFRELAIEQLGAVYEGLLEYEPHQAQDVLIEVRAGTRELVLTPDELVRLCEARKLRLSGPAELVADTAAAHLHLDARADEAADLGPEEEEPDEEEVADSEGNGDEDKGLKKGAAARLVRRLAPGEFLFVPGSARKASGSFYTCEEMVQYLVRESLQALVEGRGAAEIEALRVIDPACGSAHFLVGAARYLGQALHAAYRRELRNAPPATFHPQREADSRVRGDWEQQGEAWCRRRVIERCLFGVDLNPTAVQLAQVALWIESLAGDRPLSFFAHHVRCGNSLLGTWLDRLDAPMLGDTAKAARERERQPELFGSPLEDSIRRAVQERLLIERPLPADVPADSPAEFVYKADRLRRAEDGLATARLLFDLRAATAFLPEVRKRWWELLRVPDLATHVQAQPWAQEFAALRTEQRFFHWELEFPEILRSPRGGFDAVLGNPPWDKVLPTKAEFYARRDMLVRALAGSERDARIRELHAADPGLASRFEAYRRQTTAYAQALRGGDFPLSKGRTQAAHEDVSKFFLERSLRLLAPGRALGLVLPSNVYNGDGCAELRRHLLEAATIRRFYAFENREKIFPIDSRYKFVCLVAARAKPAADGLVELAFMRHDVAELADPGPKPWTVCVTPAEIARLSPESLAFPEYRGPRDRELLLRMYRTGVILADPPGGESWGARFMSWRVHEAIFNASEDKDLWTDPETGRLYTPAGVLGLVPADLTELLAAMAARGFVPVYEGKHVDQFLVGVKPVRWWLSVAQCVAKYGWPPRPEPTLVFRETASNTNERTCIAAILPAGAAASHTTSGVVTAAVSPDAACTVLNSLVFDWALRLRTAGTHVSFTYLTPMPVPPASVTNRLPVMATRLAWEAGVGHITETESLWPQLWQANRAVAKAYGLTAADFAHILATFPGMARKRPRWFAYLQARLDEWSRER